MEPVDFYNQQIQNLETDLGKLQKQKSYFGWLRFGTIAAIIIVVYILWSIGILYILIVCVVLLAIFVRLIHADLENKGAIKYTKLLININKNELKYLVGDYYDFDNGNQYIPKEHLYANDLDIFGRASLFQYLNRSTSEMGSNCVAEYLQYPAPPDLIIKRQLAIEELSGEPQWRQNLQALGGEKQILFSTKHRLENWMQEVPVFTKYKLWKWLRYLLPCIILSVAVLYSFNIVGSGLLYFFLLVFAIIAYQINKIVSPIHEKLSKIADELDVLSVSIMHIETGKFKNTLLQELQMNFLQQDIKASQEIKHLKKILDKLDLRYNLMLSAPLNILLLWNLQQILDLEKWKSGHQKNINIWFEALGHFEALNSFATLYFNEPDWIFPSILPKYFFIEGKEIGHPLILKNKRVNNNIDIQNAGELMLVTGSNMAGKSTYLRSIGVNVVLAMAGAAVCAKTFKVSHVQVLSSMRITDNLAESTSTFYAELKKLKIIIEKVNNGEKVFILLDEILRGTNSLDRHTGSVALIKQLIKHNAVAVIATHDLDLAKLKDDYPKNIINYHFDVQVSNDELFFDYRLNPGVCTSLNASILMKKIGIEL
ncbi:MAG: MutS family DNA mismatch repair protein [Chitinophagaceae bacterium]